MKKLPIILLLMFVVVGCDKNSNGPEEITPKLTNLVGTSWKLVGFFDIERNELIEPNPKDKECYGLKFDTDSNIIVAGYVNTMHRKYSIDYSASTIQFRGNIIVTLVGGDNVYDEEKFFAAINNTKTIELIDNKLKLYYQDDSSYLLLQKVES